MYVVGPPQYWIKKNNTMVRLDSVRSSGYMGRTGSHPERSPHRRPVDQFVKERLTAHLFEERLLHNATLMAVL